ncbi:MAG: mitofilin family membrane protein [Hyphomonadaceae bacterium]|nr:mitofilin family membrane protein [Hyphomonadaceae bacterium]
MSASDSSGRDRAEPIDVEFEPADRASGIRRSGGVGFGTALTLSILAGLAGAAGGALAPRIPAVDQRLDEIAPDATAAAAGGQASGQQLVQAQAAIDARVRAIESLISGASAETASAEGGDAASLAARVFAAQAQIRALEQRLATLPTGPEVVALTAEVQRMQQELPAIAASSRSAGEAARAAFAVSAAAEASRSSGPFEQSYASLRALLPDDPNVQALAPLARTGAPTRVELRDSFTRIENDIIRAARQAQAGAGFWGRIQAAMAQWVTVRRSGEGDTVAGVVERAGQRLAADDLAGAVQELNRLSGPAASVAQPWLNQARRRLEIDTRLGAIRTQLSRGA